MAAFDLATRTLLWRRTVATRGLLNVVAAPQLGPGSTCVAQPGWEPGPPAVARRRVISDGEREVALLDPVPYVPYDPASGVPPRQIRLAHKVEASSIPPDALPPHLTGAAAYVPLRHVDVTALAAALAAHPEIWDAEAAARDNAVLGGREGNMARFKPGCGTAHLVFSDQQAAACFSFPWWDAPGSPWRAAALPLITEILGWYGVPAAEAPRRIVRLQLARMAPGGAILKHSDKGGWAVGLHRTHIPVVTNPDVRFVMQADAGGAMLPLHVAPGDVFEINNAIPHFVQNSAEQERVHLLLDWAEAPLDCTPLARGQRCQYANVRGIIC